MTIVWQPLIAGLIVTLAAFWIGRQIYKTIRSGLSKNPGEGNACGSCVKNPNAKPGASLVQLDRPPVNDQDLVEEKKVIQTASEKPSRPDELS